MRMIGNVFYLVFTFAIICLLSSGCASYYNKAGSLIFNAAYDKYEADFRLKKINNILQQKDFDINEKDKIGRTLLYRACGYKYALKKIVSLLIEKGADVNAAANDGTTPMMQAVEHGNIPIVQRLLDSNANISLIDKNGNSALYRAVLNNNEEMVDLLLKNGADFSQGGVNKEGRSPIMMAAMANQASAITSLIKKGGDVNAVDNDGMSALAWAAKRGHPEIVELLIANGADVNLGRITPLECVLEKKYTTTSMMSKYSRIFQTLKQINNSSIEKMLIKNGAKLTSTDEKKAWKLITNSISASRLELFIGSYPDGEYASTARLYLNELKIVKIVRFQNDDERCVIPVKLLLKSTWHSKEKILKIKVSRIIRQSIENNQTLGRTLFDNCAVESGKIEVGYGNSVVLVDNIRRGGLFGSKYTGTGSGPHIPCGDGSILVFSGDNGTIYGDESDPLKLAYIEDTGLVYMGGRGKILDDLGRTMFDNINTSESKCSEIKLKN